jgi:ligand-binding sensor domain-containing protein
LINLRAICFLLLLCCAQYAGAQAGISSDFWLNDANAPVKVNDMAEDAQGYIWLATDEGVFRFNGRSFIQITDSLHKPATAVCYTYGRVWVGYNNGTLATITGQRIITVPVNNERPLSAITSISSGPSHVLWLTTEGDGLFALVNNVAIACNTGNGLSDNFVYNISELPGNRIVASTDKGINEINIKHGKISVKPYTTSDGLPDNIVRVAEPIPNTTLYMLGTQQGGLAFFCQKSRQVWVPESDKKWAYGQVNDIIAMDDKRAWAVTEDGYLLEVRLLDYDHITIKPYFFAGKHFKKIHCGRSGVLWCATDKGLTLIPSEYMDVYPVAAPYKMESVRAMVCDTDNTMWFSQGKVLYHMYLDQGNPKPAFTLPAEITSLYIDGQDRIWIGTLGKGLWYRDERGVLKNITGIPPLVNESVLDITGTYDCIWVSGLNGVEELSYPGYYTQQVTLLKQHNKHSGIGSDYVYQLYPDRKGRIWMATDGAGVCMYDKGRYTRWDSASGMHSKVVYTIAEDGLGNIWAGTLGDGLYRYNDDNKKWTRLTTAQGLQDIHIATIAANATGQVAVVNSKGIDVWYPQSEQFRKYKIPNFFTDSLSNTLKLYANDKAGNIYLPGDKGIVQFKNIYRDFDIRPFVHIDAISVFFKKVPFGTADFTAGQNHISFDFEGINFSNPDKLHYRYKLDGYNDSWIVTSDESVTFPQLRDGEYAFHIQASHNDAFSNKGESVYRFVIDKPFWRRIWFICLVGILLVGIAYTYIHVREQNIRKLSSLQRERMMFEYEHLKSQVNPHFLFNSLNTLTSLIDEDTDAAMTYTTRLSDLYRNMLSYRDRDLIALSEEWEILQNYLYIQQTRFGKALSLVADIPQSIMRNRKIVPLALQLLVENAIKHNVVSLKDPLTIYITADEESITVRNRIQPKLSKEKGAGLGLINIRKRYSLLSKKIINFGVENNEYTVTLPLL